MLKLKTELGGNREGTTLFRNTVSSKDHFPLVLPKFPWMRWPLPITRSGSGTKMGFPQWKIQVVDFYLNLQFNAIIRENATMSRIYPYLESLWVLNRADLRSINRVRMCFFACSGKMNS